MFIVLSISRLKEKMNWKAVINRFGLVLAVVYAGNSLLRECNQKQLIAFRLIHYKLVVFFN